MSKSTRVFRRVRVLLIGAVALGCSDGDWVTAPDGADAALPLQVSHAKGGQKAARTTADQGTVEVVVAGTVEVQLVDRLVPLTESLSASLVIGRAGGLIILPFQGALYVPGGALNKDVEITVTALAGSKVAFELQPHGLKFRRPVQLWMAADLPSVQTDLFAVYFEGDHQNKPSILEVFPVWSEMSWIKLETTHFSGFALASGRSARF